jgi:hypothetical protein
MIPSAATSDGKANESRPRRSTRIATDVLVELKDERFAYAGETVTVNLHGTLLRSSAPLNVGDRIVIHVHHTGKSAPAVIVFAGESSQFGVELESPENIWGVAVPPEDWDRSEVPVSGST